MLSAADRDLMTAACDGTWRSSILRTVECEDWQFCLAAVSETLVPLHVLAPSLFRSYRIFEALTEYRDLRLADVAGRSGNRQSPLPLSLYIARSFPG